MYFAKHLLSFFLLLSLSLQAGHHEHKSDAHHKHVKTSKKAVTPAMKKAKQKTKKKKSHAHHSLDAHVHGHSKLQFLAVENKAQMALQIPAPDLYQDKKTKGFEVYPKNKTELALFKKKNFWLRNNAHTFVNFEKNKCVHETKINTLVKTPADAHEHHDVRVNVRFKCEKPIDKSTTKVVYKEKASAEIKVQDVDIKTIFK